jgi:uncharacterized protein YfkK (UPF0435 family)
MINISFNDGVSYYKGLQDVLDTLNDTNNEDVPRTLIQKLEGLIENHDVMIEEDTTEMRTMKNYLETSNTTMKRDILDFIKRKAKVSRSELTNITKFINTLMVWRFDTNANANSISDNGLYTYINFFKNFISLFSIVFPNMIINKQVQTIYPHTYWKLTNNHEAMIVEMVTSFYKPIEKFYGQANIANILHEIQPKTNGIMLLSTQTPALTNIKIGDKEIYSAFDKNIVTQLYEYYILSIFSDYISLTQNPTMIAKMLHVPESPDDNDGFNSDLLVEQQLRFTETDNEFVQGAVSNLQQDVATLLVAYINIMMKAKKTINISFEDIEDRLFKLKEAEKYTFTDRLRDMNDEARDIDTILKYNKIGPLYSIGLSKGLKKYDKDNFEHDKMVAEKIAGIQNKLNKSGTNDRNMDLEVDDEIDNINVDNDIQEDNDMDIINEWDDADPWGENEDEY